MAASAAAVRLERLVGADVGRVGANAGPTPREQAVLRQASIGQTLQETAQVLGLGEETIRSHLKKAQIALRNDPAKRRTVLTNCRGNRPPSNETPCGVALNGLVFIRAATVAWLRTSWVTIGPLG